jgi:hypothetical protein
MKAASVGTREMAASVQSEVAAGVAAGGAAGGAAEEAALGLGWTLVSSSRGKTVCVAV